MKTVLIFCAVLAAAVAFPGETYNSRYDNFDAKPLVENPRVLQNYGNCFLHKGPCTPEGLDFRKIIPEALRTSCAKCTPKQQELVRIVVEAFKSQLPEVWDELVKKEDPKGEFTADFNKFLSKKH